MPALEQLWAAYERFEQSSSNKALGRCVSFQQCLPCQASAMQRKRTFSCRLSCNSAVQHMGWNAERAHITSVRTQRYEV